MFASSEAKCVCILSMENYAEGDGFCQICILQSLLNPNVFEFSFFPPIHSSWKNKRPTENLSKACAPISEIDSAVEATDAPP